MVEEKSIVAKKIKGFANNLDPVFDLSSGGMGIHLHAVADFAAGRELAEWVRGSLSRPSSNYLINPYVFGWRWKDGQDTSFRDSGPYATSPNSDAHLRLFDAMEDEYARLRCVQMRLVLGGEEALSVPNPEAPITDEEEFQFLLVKANERGLIRYNLRTPLNTGIIDSDSALARALARNDIEVSEDLWTQWDTIIKFSDRFRDVTLQVAVHKLGCMLVLTEQLTFDAEALGIPVAPTYRPSDPEGRGSANWQKLFNESMPDIEGLYRQAHAVFVANALPEDSFVAHLFAINTLPHLKSI